VLLTAPVSAEVLRVVVESRADVLNGKSWGTTGAYEKLYGMIYYAIDPRDPANQAIVDLKYAPVNAQGKVEFSGNFLLIRPKDMTRGNGTVLLDLANRGTKRSLTHFNRATATDSGYDTFDPATPENFGDGFLMEEGFTLLWLGWQFDIPESRRGVMRASVPNVVASAGIAGMVRVDFVVNADEKMDGPIYSWNLADRNMVAYQVSDPEAAGTQLTVRDSAEGPRRVIPRSEWQFARVENGQPVRDMSRVYLKSGFQKNKIYEAIYQAANPAVAGLSMALVRDGVAMLKYAPATELGIPRGSIAHAIGFGSSQPSRILRTMMYFGMNADEQRRKVFDGIFAHVPGGALGSFNHRFAQPSRDAHAFLNFFYPVDVYPFTDVAQLDPVTGRNEGVLSRLEPQYLPKMVTTLSSYEYWGRSGSLVTTTLDGRRDAPMLESSRVYHFAGAEHLPKAFPPTPEAGFRGQYTANPNDYTWMLRALVVRLNRWIKDGTPAPASKYPTIAEGTLVTPAQAQATFPDVPGVTFPQIHQKAYRIDYGPRFLTEGIIDQEPPAVGPAFPIMVPQVNADGNEIGGLQTPQLAVPLATFAGWNWYNDDYGPTNVIARMLGSYIPFAKTREQRQQNGDPRPSIMERYKGRDHYIQLVEAKARDLVAQGYLLERDVVHLRALAGQEWDYAMR
jgi:hypothetical protein